MKGKIIMFRIRKHTTHKKTVEFCNKFYGYTNKSNFGKYSYRRSGFIDKFPHVILIRSVIIVRCEHADEIIAFLGQYSREIYVRTVFLTDEDAKNLGLGFR